MTTPDVVTAAAALCGTALLVGLGRAAAAHGPALKQALYHCGPGVLLVVGVTTAGVGNDFHRTATPALSAKEMEGFSTRSDAYLAGVKEGARVAATAPTAVPPGLVGGLTAGGVALFALGGATYAARGYARVHDQ